MKHIEEVFMTSFLLPVYETAKNIKKTT